MTIPLSQNSPMYRLELDGDTATDVQKQDEHEDVFVLPASFAQQRLWFLEQWEPGVYNIPFSVGLTGQLDISAVEQAFQEIIQRHEALRTTFNMVESQLMQIVAPRMPFSLNIIDLQMFSEDVRRTKGRRLIKEQFHRPFDLRQGPLLRVTLLKLREQSHALLLCMHHIVSDAWSMEVLFNEFKTLYAAYVNGQPSPLPPLAIQYADYAIWQRNWLQGDVLNEQLDYWKKQLAGLPALQLPFDHPRPAIQTFRGAMRNIVVPGNITSQLNLLSRNTGVTLFMVLLGAYQTLLYRYTDQPCIPVGIPIAGRTESNLEPLIGCFINTLVIRTDFDDNPTFLELLKRVRETALGAYEHQDVPFEKLVESLQPDRNLSHNPLTQVMFALQNVPQEEVHLPNLSFVALNGVERTLVTGLGAQTTQEHESQLHRAMSENKTAMFDLDMTFWERGEKLVAEIKYNTDLFEPATIDRLQEHFLTLLKSIVANPAQRVNDLSLLPSEERTLLIEEWNATETPYPLTQLFHEFVIEQAQATPTALAVSDDEEQLSYRDLLTRAEQLAAHLQALGIRPEQEQLLGLYVERSVSWAVAVLAIMLAGGVYLPLDPHHPAGRLRYVLQHAGCQRVLTTRAQVTHLSDLLDSTLFVQVHCIEDLLEQGVPKVYQPIQYSGEHLAYVIYTSGSTGMPKGVMVEHKGMLNHLLAKVEALELGEQDIVAQTASHCFDISVWQLLAAWLVGGHTRIYPEQVAIDPEALLQHIETDAISVIEVVPSLLRATLDLLDLASNGPRPALSHLRWMIPTGESLGTDLVQRWFHYYAHIPLLNAYGPTECSDDVTHHVLTEVLEPEALGSAVPIGRALPNLRVYVLDVRQRLQPVGIWGEIYVGGVGVGRGYLADPVRTAQSFVPDPFATLEGGRLYRTGDVGRYHADGTIEFLGRVDHQVKLRGYRIELGEIEHVLHTHPGVRESLVLVREDEPGRQRLVAYIVPQPGEHPALEDLQRLAREALPEYMIPTAFVQLEAFPLMPNGKINRQELPVPGEQDVSQSHTDYLAPRTPLEWQLADLWSTLLGVERVGVSDDFFALGGHSLLTVRLVSEIEKLFGKRLPLAAIFQNRTIATLAQVLSRPSDVAPWALGLEQPSQKLDLLAEAVLDMTDCPEVWPDEFNAEPANILLTGATGFLGTFLLADLLKSTQADIYCLVRAKHEEQAMQRLQASLTDAFQWQPEFRARIKPVLGDLALPRLGLSEEVQEELAQRIDTIYHNGAQVNMLYPYEELKAANVQGTRELIRLATRYKIKPFHYISTLSVFPHTGETRIQYVREQEVLDNFHKHIRGGYGQSKWVAEKIVGIARARGLPVVVYRPGRITGHSQSGFWRSEDILYRMIKGCLQLGMCPTFPMNNTLEMTPVDFASQAIVALSKRKSSLGQSFHICCPPGAEAPINDIMDWIATAGYPLQHLPYEEWFEELTNVVSQGQENELAAILPLLPQPSQSSQEAKQPLMIVQDNRYTMKILARAAITCPAVDQHLLCTYLAYMAQSKSCNVSSTKAILS